MLADLLSDSYETDLEEYWENERTATPVSAFTVCLHQTGCSLRNNNDSNRIRARLTRL